jgi:hypothetical protein
LAIAGRLLAEASDRTTRLAALAVFPLASAALWLGYFRIIYGVFDPSAPYGGATNTSLENVVRGLPGLLFDQQFGLLANAPVFLCAVLGLGVLLLRGPRRLGVELLVISVPYVAVVSVFYMWWGGFSAPARFVVPLTLLLVIPTASWYATRRTIAARTAGLAALYVSLAITATLALVERGDLSINVRDGASRLLTWLSPVVDLTTAVPSLFQNPPAVATMHAAVWLVAALVVVVLAGTLGRTGQHARGGRATFAASVLILGVLAEMGTMAAASLVWWSNRTVVERPDTGALALLQQYEPDGRQIALAYQPFRRVRLRDVPPLLGLTHTVDLSSGEQSVLLHVPPGTYEVSGTSTAQGDGFVRVVMESESAPLAEWRVASFGPTWSTRFTLPVGVRALRIDVDAAARRTIRDVSVRAVSILPRRQRLAGNPEAERVGRYGPAVVFLLGGTAWLEPPGAWVAPGAGADVAIMPDAATPIRLLVRNGPIQNVATLRSEVWHTEVVLQPDEERIIDVPMAADTPTTPLHVQAARGVRPADADPTSQDRRLLGLWIETR